MKKTIIMLFKAAFITAAAVILSVSCSDKGKTTEELGEQLIYMPQASMYNGGITNEYPVPLEGISVPNYTISDEGQLQIVLGVYRSGEAKLEAYDVSVSYDAAATAAAVTSIGASAVAIPEGVFSFPDKVSVKDGERSATFYLTVDMAAIRTDHPDYYDKQIVCAVSISNPSKYKLNESLSTTVVSITGSAFIDAPEPEPTIVNLVKCGDFGTDASTYWTIKKINDDDVDVMRIRNGQLEISRDASTPCTDNKRVVCYNHLESPLEAGKWYKMSVKISVPTPVTWYSRGIDLGFCVFGLDPAVQNDYKANKDKIFFVDTDMEAARKEVGPLHGTDGFVNFPTVCTYCNPAELKTNGGIFQAVEGQEWVGFYLRQRNTLLDMNTVIFDDVMIYEVEEPAE